MILYGIALVFNMCFTSRTPETPHERGRVCDQPRIEDGVQFPHPWKMSWHGLQEQRTRSSRSRVSLRMEMQICRVICVAPFMFKSLIRKLQSDCIFVFVNEHMTSALCSCCHEKMAEKQESGTFRIKLSTNKGYIRTCWHCYVKAINILLLFLLPCLPEEK